MQYVINKVDVGGRSAGGRGRRLPSVQVGASRPKLRHNYLIRPVRSPLGVTFKRKTRTKRCFTNVGGIFTPLQLSQLRYSESE